MYISIRKLLAGAGCALALLAANPAKGVVSEFSDGLLPSAKGWTFIGQDHPLQPLLESQVATVAGGLLHLDTMPFGGGGSNFTLGYWEMPPGSVDPDNYRYEIRMRAIAPNATRSCFGGLYGAGINVQGTFRSTLGVMVPQAELTSFTPEMTADTCFHRAIDASVFHTYSVEVRDADQARFLVDGLEIAQGTLNTLHVFSQVVNFGGLTTSGGNSTADVEFIRVETISEPSSTMLLGVGLLRAIPALRRRIQTR